jgi:hypothetical protein
LQQDLQVVNGFQRRRCHANTAAITDACEIEIGKFAVIETGLRMGGPGQADEVLADVLVDIVGDGVRVSVTKHAAAITQQMAVHGAVLDLVIIMVSRLHRSQYAPVLMWAIARRIGYPVIEHFYQRVVLAQAKKPG